MSATWIKKLNESDSRLHKENIIRQALTAALLGNENANFCLEMLQLCYDTYITFGVRQIPETVGIINAENPWTEFTDLLIKLKVRVLTGHDARDAIQSLSERFDSDEWNNFLAPVLRRDMRCGISSTTINKVCKNTKYAIAVFGCQLATNSEGRPEMKGVKRLEPKLDGVRVLMAAQMTQFGPIVTSYSRNGKVFENFKHIEKQIGDNLTQLLLSTGLGDIWHLAGGIVFDGEVVGNSFQELMRQARRKTDVQNDDSVYHIFDVIPMDDFKRGHWNAQLSKRLVELRRMNPVIDAMPNVELLPHIEVNLDNAEGHDQFNHYCKDMVSQGFEGVMVKSLDAPYECKRNTSWMKYKPVLTVDLEVVGVEEGTGRNKGRLGALVCHGVDHGKEISVNVGSGFSDSDRTDYWENRNLIVGQTAEILCDVITQNQDGTYSLRFPRFVRFRDDK
jgi:DNA ligase 1